MSNEKQIRKRLIKKTIIGAAFLSLVLLFPGNALRGDTVVVRPISKSDYNAQNCGGVSGTLNYLNMFQICYHINSNTGFQSGDQIAVATGTDGSGAILGWTNVAANTTFSASFSSNMVPGNSYYILYKRSGTIYSTDNGFAQPVSLEIVPPSISDNQAGDETWRNSGGTTYDVDFSDNAHLDDAYYTAYTGSIMSGSQVVPWTAIFNNYDSTSYTSNWSINFTSLAQGYNYISVKVTDAVTHETTLQDVFTVKKDTVAPTHSINTGADLPTYWNTAGNVTLKWTASDSGAPTTGSGINCFSVQYKDTSGGSWTDFPSGSCFNPGGGPTYQSAFTPTEGHPYTFRVRATDIAGNSDSYDSEGTYTTLVDRTAPAHSVVALAPYTQSTSVNVTVNCSDTSPGSGIAAINLDKWDETSNPGTPVWDTLPQTACAGPSVAIPFTGVEGHIYHFRAQAVDKAGNTDSFDANPGPTYTQLDTRVPNDSYVNTFGVTHTPNLTFSVSWTGGSDPTPGSGLKCYDIQVRKDGGTWTDWQSCTTATSATFDAGNPPGGIASGNGIWQFRSRAQDNTGNIEAWPAAEDAQMIVDTTPPVFDTAGGPPYVIDGPGPSDITYTGSGNTLEAFWSSYDTDADPAGDLDHYEYAIGTTAGGNDILDWTSVAQNTSMTNNSLTLVHNTVYYVSVRSYNKAGIYTQQPSNGVKVDLVAPTVNMSEPNASVVGEVTFNVTWSGVDGTGESGLVNFTVQSKDNAGLWTDLVTNTTNTTQSFTGVNGHTYYFRVKAQDNVGNWTAYPTSPDYYVKTTVNTDVLSAPSPISDGSETGADLNFTNANTQLSGNWGTVNGAVSYAYAVGTTAGGTDIVGWTETPDTFFTKTGLSLADDGKTYYLSVKAKKITGTFGTIGTSNGIKIDLAVPTCSITMPSTSYQTTTSFSVQWNSADSRSGVAGTDVQYRDGETGAWTDLTTNDSGTAYLFTLGEDGHKYYFQCRATDVAGNSGAYPGGDGDVSTTVDSSVLPAPATINDGTGEDIAFTSSLTTLEANWSAVTNAASYLVCFGDGAIPNNCNVMNWTDVGNVTTYTKTGLTLTQAGDYFVRVKSKNNAGTEGPPNNSDGLTVDSLAPAAPAVTDDGGFTNNATSIHATWTGTPGVSGIMEYQYAIGTSAGGNQVVDWTSTSLTTNVTKTGLTLTDGLTYYVSVKAKSSAGVWSTAGSSDGILIDTTPPTCAIQALPAYTGSNTINVQWAANDSGSGLANLYYVQSKDGATGNWSNWQIMTSVTSADFTAGIDGHTFYFQCKALDNSGNWSAYPGGDGDTHTTVASSVLAAPAVRDGSSTDVAYSTSADTIEANWDAVTGAVSYIYAIGTTAGGDELKTWTSTTVTSFSETGLALINGTTYYTTVKAQNAGGINGTAGTSNGVLVDTTPPDTPSVLVPDAVTSETTFLTASWTGGDAQSGITEYQVSVGTSAGDTSIKSWYSTGTAAEATIAGLTLHHGSTYYINVKSQNATGVWSDVGSSVGVLVNTTLLPGPSSVKDGTGADESFTSSNTSLSANWTSVSNAISYDYAIGTTPGARNVVDWTSAGSATTVTKSGLTLSQGATYYFAVRAHNPADVPGPASISNGIRVDSNPPGQPVVSYANGNYSTSASSLSASWTSVAGISGIAEYQYAVGTTSGGTEVVNWTSAGSALSGTINATMTEGGTYYISVKARSDAGVWSTAGTYGGILVDSQSPTCSVQALAQYQPANSFTVNWSGTDTGSGMTPLYTVQSKIGADGTWTDWQSNTSVSTAVFTGTNGNNYFFQCKSRDNAGNWSAYPGGNGNTGTTIDSVAPATPVVSDGTGTDIAYSTSGNTISANWPAVSGTAEYFHAIGSTSGGTDVLGWTTSGTTPSFTASALALADGATYYVAVKARNNANLYSGTGVSNGVKIDTTPPTTPTVSVPDVFSSSNTYLEGSWSSSDAHTGVTEYQVSVGTAAGLADTKDWFSAGTQTSMVISGLTMTNGQTYYINVRAVNAAGLVSAAGTSDGVKVDSTLLPGPTTINDGTAADIDFTSSTTTLSANWSAITGASKYEYAIGTTSGGRNVVDWTSVNTSTSVTKTGLTLTQGTTYYVVVRARNSANIPGTGRVSDGITIDTAKPGTPAVTYNGSYSTSKTQLPATWTATAGLSGISEYQYAVGTTAGGTNTLSWTSAGADTNATIPATLTEGGTYYISVKAKSGAAVFSDAGTSGAVTVDTTAPSCSVAALSQYTAANTFAVTWSGNDAGTGLASSAAFDVQVREGAAGTWQAWRTGTSLTSFDYTGSNTKTYYFRCRARDKAGNVSEYPASPDTSTIIDSVAPGKPAVSDGTAADVDYVTVNNSLSANWNAVTLAAAYSYAVGTTSGGTDVVNWTETTGTSVTVPSLSLTNGGRYYFSVKARNNAKLYGEVGTSDGVLVDTTAPSTPQVYTPAEYTASQSTLEASWTASDSESGITDYQVSVGTSAGDTSIKNWYSAGAVSNASITGLSMSNGGTYFINVKAVNAAGLASAIGSSTGVTVDTTLLAAPSVVNDGTGADIDYNSSADTLSANWSAISGASKYDYRIGSTPGAGNALDWTDAGTETKFTKSGLTLVQGTKYYVTVRARNNAGTPGSAKISDGITIDTAAPGTPAVTVPGAFVNSLTQLTAEWSATAGLSGIVEYQTAVGSTEGGAEAANWTSKGTSTSGTITASMQSGGKYYVSVKAKSGAGVWSAAGTAQMITVDTTKPVCAVQQLSAYQANATFNVSWTGTDSSSGPAGTFDVQYRDGATGVWTDWLAESTLTSNAFSGLNTHVYYFRCRTKDNAGNISDYADAGDTHTTIDSIAPVAATVRDGSSSDVDYSTDGASLSANWDQTDYAISYSYAIGTTPGSGNVVGWTDTTSTSFTKSGLTLASGQTYYVSVKGKNHAGTEGSAGVSNGVMVDTTAPTTPLVYVPAAYTSSTNTLSGSWSSEDPDSGIAEYQVSIGTAVGGTNVKGWTSVGSNTSTEMTGLTLTNGGTYFLNVKAVNRAGSESTVGTSSAVTVDTTLLSPPSYVRDSAGSDSDYTTSNKTLSANWADVSGAAKYQYAVGGEAGMSDIVVWTDTTATSVTVQNLSLTNGKKYYFSVRGVNNAGTGGSVGSSDGITVDTTAPAKPTVTDDGSQLNMGTPMHFTFNSSDSESPIVKYEYAIGLTAGATDAKDWTSAGLNKEVSDSTAALVTGKTYVISVRATNAAGLVSEVGASDGIQVVTTANVSAVSMDNQPLYSYDVAGNIVPNMIIVPDTGSDLSVLKEIAFRESNGVGVTYDQVQMSWLLEGGTRIDDPTTSINLRFLPGSETRTKIALMIPSRVLSLALGGRASSIITIEYTYSGMDDSKHQIKTVLSIPLKLTTSQSEESFQITGVKLLNPADGASVPVKSGYSAKAEVTLTGSGSVGGVWLLDGEFYKAFRTDAMSVKTVAAEQALPPDITGSHTLQFRVTAPESKESQTITFNVGEAASGPDATIDNFFIGPVQVTGVTATYDPATMTYTGEGDYKIPMLDDTVHVQFKRLKIEKQNGSNVLTKGIIAVTVDKKIEKGPISVSISKLLISTDGSALADGSVSFAGTDSLPGIGPFYFYSAGITKDGIKAAVKLGSPQTGKVGYFELGITDIYFDYGSSGATIKAVGYITTTPQEIFKFYVYFGYSPGGTEFDYAIGEKKDWIPAAQ